MSTNLNNLVRQLVKRSTSEEGIIEQSLVEDVLAGLREIKPSRYLEILKHYLIEIRKSLRVQVVEVELGCQPNELLVSKLRSKIESIGSGSLDLNVTRNDNLVAGYRIRIVDDVFEDSIQSRLAKLSHSLTT